MPDIVEAHTMPDLAGMLHLLTAAPMRLCHHSRPILKETTDN